MAQKWTPEDIPDQTGKRVVITGANSGLGYDMARELARKQAHVIMACRSQSRGEAALEQIRQSAPNTSLEVVRLDLADLASVRAFAETMELRGDAIDILCNNAGVMAIPYRQTADGFEMQFGANHLGHFALTGLLLPRLLQAPAARIVTVSSNKHKQGKLDFDDLNWKRNYSKWAAYARSKLANLLFAFELQRKLAGAGKRAISVAAHPGYAATNLQYVGPQMENAAPTRMIMHLLNSTVAQPSEQGARPQLYAATAPDVQGGDYIGPDGLWALRGAPTQVNASKAARDETEAAQLWQISEELTGVRYTALETVPT